MTRHTARRWYDERAMGLAGVVVLGLVVMTAASVAAGVAVRSVRVSGTHVDFETAVHLAEQGIDQTVARLQAEPAYATSPAVAMPAGMAAAEERAWALAHLAAPGTPVERLGNGEVSVVKPVGSNVVYAAGWVPSRERARRTRLIKAEYLFSTYRAEHAFLAGGDLLVSGGATVDGPAGAVHANGDVTISGSATVTGSVTAAKSLAITGGGASVGPGSDGDQPERSVPTVDPLAMWDQLAADHLDDWYDLCPDGTVRRPDGVAPCAGSVLFDPSVDRAPFRGWVYAAGRSTWTKDGSGEYAGVYFVHRASADIGRSPGTDANPWRATVIAGGTGTGAACEQDGGDIAVTGSPVMGGFITGLTLVAGRDLTILGTPAQRFGGVLAAHEQILVTGNPTVVGALLSEDACDTPSSPVHTSEVSGSMHITYDGALDVTLGLFIRTTLWLEL